MSACSCSSIKRGQTRTLGQFMCRVFRDYSRYFMQLGGQDLRQNPDFAVRNYVQLHFAAFHPHLAMVARDDLTGEI